jgi:hypothetical protein
MVCRYLVIQPPLGAASMIRSAAPVAENGFCARALLECCRAKWEPVRVKKTRQNKGIESLSGSI